LGLDFKPIYLLLYLIKGFYYKIGTFRYKGICKKLYSILNKKSQDKLLLEIFY